jgi:hypothetical protein
MDNILFNMYVLAKMVDSTWGGDKSLLRQAVHSIPTIFFLPSTLQPLQKKTLGVQGCCKYAT